MAVCLLRPQNLKAHPVFCYPVLSQDLNLGSSELIYVPGSPLPITIEEEEEEEEENGSVPRVPPRVPKLSHARTPEPRISFSYTADPRTTPSRKVSPAAASAPPLVTAPTPPPPSRPTPSMLESLARIGQALSLYTPAQNLPKHKRWKMAASIESRSVEDLVGPELVVPPPRRYATIQKKKRPQFAQPEANRRTVSETATSL